MSRLRRGRRLSLRRAGGTPALNPFLRARLRPAVKRARRLTLALCLAACWTVAALAGAAWWWKSGGVAPAAAFLTWLAASLALAALTGFIWSKTGPDYKRLIRRIEERYPSLNGRLLTASQLEREGQDIPDFFRQRLLEETLLHSTQSDWSAAVGKRRLAVAQVLHGAALVAFLTLLFAWGARVDFRPAEHPEDIYAGDEFAPVPPGEVSVTPGDTLLEKGSSLVVLARFSEPVPASANLVIGNTPETERRFPLTKNLNDPVFGGSVPDVRENLRYRVEWEDGRRSRDFQVTVFEYPKLERPDITLTFPDYTKQPPKRVEDTRRVSAVEGTKLDVELQLNKPVASAVLQPLPGKPDADNPEPPAPPEPLALTTDPSAAAARLTGFIPTATREYQLVLTDDAGRTNQTKQTFRFEVLPNTPPDIKLTTPRGDARPSALEEMLFEGTAGDDFGVLAAGLAITLPNGETEFLTLLQDVPANERRGFQHVLRLEEANVKPQDLVTWFVWADDIGPDGQPRRTMGDMFFGEVRLFEEIFRQAEAQSQERQQRQQEEQQQQGGGNSPSQQLAELQKQIINATWRLRRSAPETATPAFTSDVETVRDSQGDALEQAGTAAAQAGGGDPGVAAAWGIAVKEMEKARASLDEATKDPKALAPALTAEQAAYQALLKVRARETQVARGQQRGQGQQSASEQQRQMELNEMDLTDEENRYETERLARTPQEEERREQLQVLNRLRELARRQEDATERLKELQNALEAAKTEEQREEIRRELKRLEEEQREMLADTDELNQLMNSEQNRQRMAEERNRLEETREQMRRAAEATQQGNVSRAVASGTRAQRQLQEMHDELRKETSGQFAEELRRLRGEARDLERRQREVAEAMKNGGGNEDAEDAPRGKSLTDSPDQEQAIQQLEEQRRRVADLTRRAAELSAEAENAEPLVSRGLYDTVRKFSQDDAGSVKQLQEEMLREGTLTRSMFNRMRELQEEEEGGRGLAATADLLRREMLPEAERMERAAREGLENLRQGVEKAAESVLGDDTEALQRADRELEELTRQVEREMAQNTATGQGGGREDEDVPSSGGARGGETADSRRAGGEPGDPEDATGATGGQSPRTARRGENGASRDPNGEEPEDSDSTPGAGGARGEREAAELADRGARGGERSGETEAENDEAAGEAEDSNGEGGRRGGETADARGGRRPGQGQSGQPGGAGRDQQNEEEDADGEPRTEQAQNDGERAGQSGQGGGGRSGRENGEPGRGQNARDGVRDFAFDENPGGNQRGGGAVNNARGGRGGFSAPITGDDFREWSDRLRDVEEMIDAPDLRNGVATARESARRLRVDMKRGNLKKPDWAVVKAEIIEPLAEVRKRVREELARRDSKDALVPIDRDPVPPRYTDLVRRYYQELGGAN